MCIYVYLNSMWSTKQGFTFYVTWVLYYRLYSQQPRQIQHCGSSSQIRLSPSLPWSLRSRITNKTAKQKTVLLGLACTEWGTKTIHYLWSCSNSCLVSRCSSNNAAECGRLRHRPKWMLPMQQCQMWRYPACCALNPFAGHMLNVNWTPYRLDLQLAFWKTYYVSCAVSGEHRKGIAMQSLAQRGIHYCF